MIRHKVFIIGLIFCLSSLYVNGQTEKGKFMIGGSTKFNAGSTKYESFSSSASNLDFNPSISYFIFDNLSLGFQLPLSIQRFAGNQFLTVSYAPFLRYYFLNNNIKPYIHTALGKGRENWKNLAQDDDPNGNNDDRTFKNTFYEFKGGLAIFFNKYFALDVNIGYYSNSFDKSFPNYKEIRVEAGLLIAF